MAQHFLLSPIARELKDDQLHYLLSEQNEGACYLLFQALRWGSLTTQICPKCGLIAAHTPRPKHKQFRCASTCRHDFSAKSGSLFDSCKLPYWKILKAMALWSDTPKGLSAVQLAKKINVTYEPAYLLLRKFRFALFERSLHFVFREEVEMDAVWVFKGQRKMNCHIPAVVRKVNQRRRRKYAREVLSSNPGMTRKEARRIAAARIELRNKNVWENPNKRPIVALVERSPAGGMRRGVGFLVDGESFQHIEPIARRFLERSAKVFTDAASAYSGLAAMYELEQINHQEFYSQGEGRNTNAVESSFARFRRAEWGTYHRMSPQTANGYMAENFWREEHRRTPQAERLFGFMRCMVRTGVCAELKKYGSSQQLREQAARKILHEPIKAATADGVEVLARLGLLPTQIVGDVWDKLDQLRAAERESELRMERKLEELTRRLEIAEAALRSQ